MPGPLPQPLVQRLLAGWPVARLATIAPDGRPHLVPLVFAWHAGALWSPIDGKPKRGSALARARHLAREPRVALLLDRYAADWRLLWWIRVDGRAGLRPAEAAVAEALRAKYPQYRTVPLFAGEPAVIRIEPERSASWYASDAVLDALGAG